MARPSSYHPSLSNTSSLQSSNSHSNALQTRINAKRAELDNLKQLRDLSATLASQMGTLEQKLSTLRDGTEAVAHVLANWDNVLSVIGMAGAKVADLIPKDEEDGGEAVVVQQQQQAHLPETLVRIPVSSTTEKET